MVILRHIIVLIICIVKSASVAAPRDSSDTHNMLSAATETVRDVGPKASAIAGAVTPDLSNLPNLAKHIFAPSLHKFLQDPPSFIMYHFLDRTSANVASNDSSLVARDTHISTAKSVKELVFTTFVDALQYLLSDGWRYVWRRIGSFIRRSIWGFIWNIGSFIWGLIPWFGERRYNLALDAGDKRAQATAHDEIRGSGDEGGKRDLQSKKEDDEKIDISTMKRMTVFFPPRPYNETIQAFVLARNDVREKDPFGSNPWSHDLE